jgi:HlyD family secretion protein
MIRTLGRYVFPALAIGLGLGCAKPDPNRVQGYVEGEFVYVASPYAGTVETLSVERGVTVKPGDALFMLDPEPQKAARDEAQRRLAQARASLEDLKKGKRPTEIASLEAQLNQMRAGLQRSESELARVQKIFNMGSGSEDDVVRARATRDQDIERVAQA